MSPAMTSAIPGHWKKPNLLGEAAGTSRFLPFAAVGADDCNAGQTGLVQVQLLLEQHVLVDTEYLPVHLSHYRDTSHSLQRWNYVSAAP